MQTPLTIGVDVAKDTVVVACAHHSFAPRTVPNEHAAWRSFLRSLPPGSRIGMEATSHYHERWADLAVKAGFDVLVLNPKDTRHYAKGVGLRAKTDRVDAALIARLLEREHEQLHAYNPPPKAQRTLALLLKRRAKLTTVKGIVRQSLGGLSGFGRELQTLLKRIDRLIALIDQRMAELIAHNPARAQAYARLQTIVGVGPMVGTGLTSALERIPFKRADAFVAFTGLDPRADDSGPRKGRRRLSKRGPSELRRLLFNAAMAAIKTKTWKPIYEHYRACAGLPPLAWSSLRAKSPAPLGLSITTKQLSTRSDSQHA